MEERDHLEFLDFMTEQELKAETIEANNELAEDINPTVQEINMADIRLHKVTKIEIKKVDKGSGYICRDIVIHNKEWNSDLESMGIKTAAAHSSFYAGQQIKNDDIGDRIDLLEDRMDIMEMGK